MIRLYHPMEFSSRTQLSAPCPELFRNGPETGSLVAHFNNPLPVNISFGLPIGRFLLDLL